MRTGLSVAFGILIIALLVCMVIAKKSRKPIGNALSFLLAGLTIPVLGNLILIISTQRTISTLSEWTVRSTLCGISHMSIAIWASRRED